MRVVVCLRQGLDGEINPFDACAYEAALRLPDAEITLLSMGPMTAFDLLRKLTRLGAKRAVLLSDKRFSGADTLATAYALSRAINKLSPDLVICGRQTLVGDTAQTGPMLSVYSRLDIITSVMSIDSLDEKEIICTTRDEGQMCASLPALITVERINTLRMPRLRSTVGEVEVWNADDVAADENKIGLIGSPTRVIKTFENTSGKRKPTFIPQEKLGFAIEEGLKKTKTRSDASESREKLSSVLIVGEAPFEFAKTVSENITVIPLSSADDIIKDIKRLNPPAVLWGSDSKSKRLAAIVAARLEVGLCADCTSLECENDTLLMYRPALSGSIIAKIKSLTRPAMATVRTDDSDVLDIVVTLGYGVKDKIDDIREFAKSVSAELCATRKVVDNGLLDYSAQVGLTGKTVSPPVYIAVGVSGAVHHIVGMQRAGTVIAINPDKDAPIFDYADFAIVDEFDIKKLKDI